MLDLTRWDRSSCKGILRLLLTPLISDWMRMWWDDRVELHTEEWMNLLGGICLRNCNLNGPWTKREDNQRGRNVEILLHTWIFDLNSRACWRARIREISFSLRFKWLHPFLPSSTFSDTSCLVPFLIMSTSATAYFFSIIFHVERSKSVEEWARYTLKLLTINISNCVTVWCHTLKDASFVRIKPDIDINFEKEGGCDRVWWDYYFQN